MRVLLWHQALDDNNEPFERKLMDILLFLLSLSHCHITTNENCCVVWIKSWLMERLIIAWPLHRSHSHHSQEREFFSGKKLKILFVFIYTAHWRLCDTKLISFICFLLKIVVCAFIIIIKKNERGEIQTSLGKFIVYQQGFWFFFNISLFCESIWRHDTQL